MRQTLLFGGLESIAYNRNRKRNDLRFYEFGNCYFYHPEKKKENDLLAPYSEETHLGIWICGKRTHKNWAVPDTESSVFELKAHIENILKRLGISHEQITSEPFQNDIFSTGMNIYAQRTRLGSWGIVSPKMLKRIDIDTDVFFGEINLDNLLKKTANRVVRFSEISRFPAVSRDMALLVDKNVTFAQIEQIARKSGKKLLKEVSLFDVYEGSNLPKGKKSYAVNFVLQDDEKTLTDRQIDEIMQKIRINLEKELGATLR